MYKGKKILGLITARGGSKSIPRKNIAELSGKPLIAHTLSAAQKSRYLTRCVVSTDDAEIAEVARQYGGDVPFMRPSELATDESASVSVAQHALKWLKENQDEEYDYLMILQPTSPLRASGDIDNCIKKIVDAGADSVMSMVKLTDFSLAKLKQIREDEIIPLITNEGRQSDRRQDLTDVYKRNCAIYLTRASLITEGDLFGKISRPYVMPAERSIDVNEPIDFLIVESILEDK